MKNIRNLYVVAFLFLSIAAASAQQKDEYHVIKVNSTWSMLTIDVGDMIKNEMEMGLIPIWGVHKTSDKDIIIRISPTLDEQRRVWIIKCEFGYFKDEKFVMEGGYRHEFDLAEREPLLFQGFPEEYKGPLKLVTGVQEYSLPLLINKGFVIKATLVSSESKEILESYTPIVQMATGPNKPYWFRYFEL